MTPEPFIWIAIVVVGLAALAWSRVKVAGPDQAYIVTGRKGRRTVSEDGSIATDLSGQKVVMGAAVFVWPMIQRLHHVDLSSRKIRVRIPGAISASGVRISVEALAIVKVGGSVDAVRAAAQRFLHQQNLIEEFTEQILAGAMRSVVGRMSIDDIIRNRTGLGLAVAEEAEGSLIHQGLVLDGFLIEDITSDGSYLTDLGRAEAARAASEAAIAETRARQQAEEERMRAEEHIAEAERNLALKRAAIQAEIDAAKARSAAAGQLARAEQDENILKAQHAVAQRNAELKERQLDTEIKKPADAKRYEMETDAEARKNSAVIDAEARRLAAIADAQAEAETARLTGEAERDRRAMLAEAEAVEGAKRGEAERAHRAAVTDAVVTEGDAEAKAIRARGAAEAEALRAKGSAEADAMRARADSFDRYGQAAVLDLLIKALPQVVEQAARPMESIDKLTVISTDGATDLTRTVANNVAQGLQLSEDLTGINLPDLLKQLGGAVTAPTPTGTIDDTDESTVGVTINRDDPAS